MQYFDPSEHGEQGERIEAAPKLRLRKREFVSSERSPGQWQPLGAVTRKIMERLLADQDGQP
jgi:hypothetical protein